MWNLFPLRLYLCHVNKSFILFRDFRYGHNKRLYQEVCRFFIFFMCICVVFNKARQRDTFVSCPPIFKKWWGKFSFLIIHYFFIFFIFIKKNQYLTQLVGWFLLNSKSCKRRHIPQLGVDPKCWIEFNNHLISQLFMILLIDGPKNVDKTGWLLISSWNKVLVSTACYMYL